MTGIGDAGRRPARHHCLPYLLAVIALDRLVNLAPDDHAEQVFKQILSGCHSAVTGLGALRNKLGDAHSLGPVRARPLPRHAELAVNLRAPWPPS